MLYLAEVIATPRVFIQSCATLILPKSNLAASHGIARRTNNNAPIARKRTEPVKITIESKVSDSACSKTMYEAEERIIWIESDSKQTGLGTD